MLFILVEAVVHSFFGELTTSNEIVLLFYPMTFREVVVVLGEISG